MRRTERLFQIIQILRSTRSPITGRELAVELEASPARSTSVWRGFMLNVSRSPARPALDKFLTMDTTCRL
ncbi:HTH domain-containing protein [Aliiroseovarius sp. 2305UL8-7]|uniref:HTH domain-containing protein n=1 Tax=Aliiroseovarius conchicola TaxID=3121637 RepID=UPI003529ABDD